MICCENDNDNHYLLRLIDKKKGSKNVFLRCENEKNDHKKINKKGSTK